MGPVTNGGLQAVDFGGDAVVAAAWAPGDDFTDAAELVLVVRWGAAVHLVVVAGAVAYFEDEVAVGIVVATEGVAVEVFGEAKPAAGLGTAVVAGGFEVFAAGFDFFHAQAGLCVAVVAVFKAVATGVFVDFKREYVALLVVGGQTGALRVRAFEIKTSQGNTGGDDATHRGPLADGVVFTCAGFLLKRDVGVLAVDRGGLGAVVAEDEFVAAGGVFVPVGCRRRFILKSRHPK